MALLRRSVPIFRTRQRSRGVSRHWWSRCRWTTSVVNSSCFLGSWGASITRRCFAVRTPPRRKTSMPASTCSGSAMTSPAATSTRAFTMPTRRSARLTQSQGGGAWHRRPLEGVLNSLECYDVTAAAVRYPAASAAPVQ